MKCWGKNNYGQLGNGESGEDVHETKPDDVIGLSGVARFVNGDYHTCAILNTGALQCWGLNQWGQLGNGNNQIKTSPDNVKLTLSASSILSIAAGYRNTCVLLDTGIAKCWGANSSGQLGNETIGLDKNQNVPVEVKGL